MTDETNQQENPTGGTGTEPGKQAGTPTEKMLSQSEVNNLIAQRVAETRESTKAQVASQFADFEKFKAAAEKWDEYQKSQMTDLQKLQITFDAERQNWTTERNTLAQQAEQGKSATTKLAFIEKAVREGGLTFDRATAAFKLVDVSQLEFDDKGEVKNAVTVVTKLIEEYPFLKTPEPQPQKPGAPKISPTNPSGTNTEPDMSWHPLMRNPEHRLGGGGYTLRSKGSK